MWSNLPLFPENASTIAGKVDLLFLFLVTVAGFFSILIFALVMFFAIRFGWDTHYSALPPEFQGPMDFWTRYTLSGLLPQLVAWIWFTVIGGALVGIIVNAIVRRGQAPAPVAP